MHNQHSLTELHHTLSQPTHSQYIHTPHTDLTNTLPIHPHTTHWLNRHTPITPTHHTLSQLTHSHYTHTPHTVNRYKWTQLMELNLPWEVPLFKPLLGLHLPVKNYIELKLTLSNNIWARKTFQPPRSLSVTKTVLVTDEDLRGNVCYIQITYVCMYVRTSS